MNSIVKLHWHNYKYFPYEKELAKREIEAMFNYPTINIEDDGIVVVGKLTENKLLELVYSGSFEFDGVIKDTFQFCLEEGCVVTGTQKRQSTRYSVHGIHEYKGKFNPQIVAAIFNLLGLQKQDKVLDPFCGSGTTIVESTHRNLHSVGLDINPLAVLISNSKLEALSTPVDRLIIEFEYIMKSMRNMKNYAFDINSSTRLDYLIKWFPTEYLEKFEFLRDIISQCKHERIFLTIASNLLRDYSFQEPADLRIRRRKTPFPNVSLIDAFEEQVLIFLKNLTSVQSTIGIRKSPNFAYLVDTRNNLLDDNNWKVSPPFNAVITSPPYATALPYIDTQRLSLVWLDFLLPSEIMTLESNLTGSREWPNNQKIKWINNLKANYCDLPPLVYNYCILLQSSLSDDDGFRRQSTPALIYRYFYHMKKSFENIKSITNESGYYALVIGKNRTTLGGQTFFIDTPKFLGIIAEACGWKIIEDIPLQTYQRFSIHKSNSVNEETLLILKND